MRVKYVATTSLIITTLAIAAPTHARLSPSFCSEMHDAIKQVNTMFPRTVKQPSASIVEDVTGLREFYYLDTTYLRVDVDCEEEAVIYEVRFADSEIENKLKADKKKADEAFYDMHKSQMMSACRPDGFIRKFGLKQEVRDLVDRSGVVWHRWVTSSYDCL